MAKKKTGCLQRLAGLFVILIGVIMLLIFMVDDITIIGIVDNIIPIFVIILGVKMAFPSVRIPKIGK